MTARLTVLISGSGSNLQAILDACTARTLDAKVVAVVSNRDDAPGLQRAQRAGIKTIVCQPLPDEERTAYDERLHRIVARSAPDWIVLAGWMRLLSMTFLGRFPGQVINLHPALPGEYPGLHAIESAYADARAGRRTSTGVMVHLVPDEGIDTGPVLASTPVEILASDTLDTLSARVHAAEHALLVETLIKLTKEKAP